MRPVTTVSIPESLRLGFASCLPLYLQQCQCGRPGEYRVASLEPTQGPPRTPLGGGAPSHSWLSQWGRYPAHQIRRYTLVLPTCPNTVCTNELTSSSKCLVQKGQEVFGRPGATHV